MAGVMVLQEASCIIYHAPDRYRDSVYHMPGIVPPCKHRMRETAMHPASRLHAVRISAEMYGSQRLPDRTATRTSADPSRNRKM